MKSKLLLSAVAALFMALSGCGASPTNEQGGMAGGAALGSVADNTIQH